jgi:hypothetical protein
VIKGGAERRQTNAAIPVDAKLARRKHDSLFRQPKPQWSLEFHADRAKRFDEFCIVRRRTFSCYTRVVWTGEILGWQRLNAIDDAEE